MEEYSGRLSAEHWRRMRVLRARRRERLVSLGVDSDNESWDVTAVSTFLNCLPGTVSAFSTFIILLADIIGLTIEQNRHCTASNNFAAPCRERYRTNVCRGFGEHMVSALCSLASDNTSSNRASTQ